MVNSAFFVIYNVVAIFGFIALAQDEPTRIIFEVGQPGDIATALISGFVIWTAYQWGLRHGRSQGLEAFSDMHRRIQSLDFPEDSHGEEEDK